MVLTASAKERREAVRMATQPVLKVTMALWLLMANGMSTARLSAATATTSPPAIQRSASTAWMMSDVRCETAPRP